MGSSWPVIVTGNRPPSRLATIVPIVCKGSVMRAMGRVLKDASPVNVAVMGCPATTPISRRTPVPELPRSNAVSGATRPCKPCPKIIQVPSSWRVMSAPIARMASAVANTSAPSSKPVTLVVPMAKLPRIRDRCDIDLSPGTSTMPERFTVFCDDKLIFVSVDMSSSCDQNRVTEFVLWHRLPSHFQIR